MAGEVERIYLSEHTRCASRAAPLHPLVREDHAMKRKLFGLMPFAAIVTSSVAYATTSLLGSDALVDVTQDAIQQCGVPDLSYLARGTVAGECALTHDNPAIESTQRIAPMGRMLTCDTTHAHPDWQANVIGLDAVVVAQSARWSGDILARNGSACDVLRSIYAGPDGSGSLAACSDPARITRWWPASGKHGEIEHAYKLHNDIASTQILKQTCGIQQFCNELEPGHPDGDPIRRADGKGLVQMIKETPDEPNASVHIGQLLRDDSTHRSIGFGSLALTTVSPRVVAMSLDCVAPTIESIRSFAYPLARKLYLNQGNQPLSGPESALRACMLDRCTLDPILAKRGYVTCSDDCREPCPPPDDCFAAPLACGP
jgi:hypothetical protein